MGAKQLGLWLLAIMLILFLWVKKKNKIWANNKEIERDFYTLDRVIAREGLLLKESLSEEENKTIQRWMDLKKQIA